VGDAPLETHPMIPLLQISAQPETCARFAGDLDLQLDVHAGTEAALQALLARIAEVASRRYLPRLYGSGITSFQLTRGLLGLSM
jgi:hypothetical protein